MVSSIIVSKDRAMQLELLLRSSDKYCGDLFSETLILWGSSNFAHNAGYIKLQQAYKDRPDIRWFKDGDDFETDYRAVIDSATSENLCILSDDCFFYRDVKPHKDNILRVLAREDVYAFILGIGGDSTYSGTLKYNYRVPTFTADGELLVWNWKQADRGEFACPFMLAANFYTKEDYLFCLNQIRFQNPSTLEFNCQQTWQIQRKAEMKSLCATLKYQALVHSLNNRVQDDFKNENGMEFPVSPMELNSSYLSGQVIDLENLDFSGVKGLHKEINFKYRNDT